MRVGSRTRGGHRFPQGGLDVTEGGQVIGGCHQGPNTVFTVLGHRVKRVTPFGISVNPVLIGEAVWCQ